MPTANEIITILNDYGIDFVIIDREDDTLTLATTSDWALSLSTVLAEEDCRHDIVGPCTYKITTN